MFWWKKTARGELVIAPEMDYWHVILELDNSGLVSSLKATDADRSRIASLLHEVKEHSRSFIFFGVCWVRREANSLTDFLFKVPFTRVAITCVVGLFPSVVGGSNSRL